MGILGFLGMDITQGTKMNLDKEEQKAYDIASVIEHTKLDTLTTQADIEKIFTEAYTYEFRGLCVPANRVRYAKSLIYEINRPFILCTVIGFPFGNITYDQKTHQIKEAAIDGANEVDLVPQLSYVYENHYGALRHEVTSLVDLAHSKDLIAKVIIETPLFSSYEVKKLCETMCYTGVDFIKTSTGLFKTNQVTAKLIRQIHSILKGTDIAIKASGGINTAKKAKSLLKAGAYTLGCSKSVKIMQELQQNS